MSAKNINSPESKMNVFTHEEVADSFKAGMRQFPSGITLLTSLHNGERGGLIATAFSSVSMDPPTLLTCVNKNASAHNIIYNANRICVQILSEEDLSVVSSFSDSLKRGERFITGDWENMHSGLPFIKTAVAAFDCKVVEKIACATHTIFIAEVVDVFIGKKNPKPLIYIDRAFHSLK